MTGLWFLQMATKKFLLQHLLGTGGGKKHSVIFPLCVCVFVYLFFCWTQLLGPLHAETPNMAPVLNRRLGAKQAGVEERHQRNFTPMAPSGHHFHTFFVVVLLLSFSQPPLLHFTPPLPFVVFFSFPPLAKHAGCVALGAGSVLTRAVRQAGNSSLSPAPVIEQSVLHTGLENSIGISIVSQRRAEGNSTSLSGSDARCAEGESSSGKERVWGKSTAALPLTYPTSFTPATQNLHFWSKETKKITYCFSSRCFRAVSLRQFESRFMLKCSSRIKH